MRSSGNDVTGSSLRVIQLGMHERAAGGGVDHFFWDLFDQLTAFPDLSLSAFFFRHRSAAVNEQAGESCLGPTTLPAGRRLWKLRRAVLEKLADGGDAQSTVVVSHFALYASALLPQLRRLKHVVHFQGPWAIESATEGKGRLNVGVKLAIERAVYSSANAFVTLSHAFRDLLIAEYKVAPESAHVVPPAVDVERFTLGDRQAAREQLGWPQNATILLCVRRLARRMGLEILIEAFKQIADTHPHVLLFFGGSGALRDELAGKIESFALGKRVRLLGFIPDDRLATFYQAADLSVVPSQSLEGFGLTTLESLACGTPVLVTPVGGLPEAVAGLEPKLVLRTKERADMAEWLHGFLDGQFTLPSPEDCHSYVAANFAWPAIAQRIRELYWKAAEN
jgi:glycosyltransferase involved in cell wall biosynthesis